MNESLIHESERLIIRPFEESDESNLVLLSMDLYSKTLPEDWLIWASRCLQQQAGLWQPTYGDRAVILKKSNELIGNIGLVSQLGPYHRIAELDCAPHLRTAPQTVWTPEVGMFWAIHSNHREKGYATEAAEQLIEFAARTMHIPRIIASTMKDNEASQGVMRKLGMRLFEPDVKSLPWFSVVGVKYLLPRG